MSEWKESRLSDLADIRSSNVDKVFSPSEIPVSLCNYMDVYRNDYISNNIEFMDSSATAAEIAKFLIEKGDVLITKDSETPFDIGIPAVVVDSIDSLVCGYHLALVKPLKHLVDPIFLSKQLASESVTSHFRKTAAGSTRFGLSVGSISGTRILIPSLPYQKQISKILSTIDQTIEKTEALIEKYQQIKAGLMHDLFTRGIGADGKLRPSREEAPELYQETAIGWIPNGWCYELLDKLATRGSGHTPSRSHPEYWNGDVKWLSLADSASLDQLYISDTAFKISEKGIQNSSAVLHPPGIVVLSRDAGIGKSAITTSPVAVSQHFMCWKGSTQMDNHFLYYWLQYNKRKFENIAMGSTILTIGLDYFKRLRIACPKSITEQQSIAERLRSLDMHVFSLKEDLKKKDEQKAGLMQDLLTGKVQVNIPTPEQTPN